ncbi:Manganese/iron superoxide dismutase [Gigaspora rosea]|uniref:Manganese/iron superoxide dismutase n=1 Tax=Gigaspora rosea TaxID=44941 RepID=A0A397UQK7_9GLOM|nr:Manganese/iron superoxide dismutase [Gigaspora rosea]
MYFAQKNFKSVHRFLTQFNNIFYTQINEFHRPLVQCQIPKPKISTIFCRHKNIRQFHSVVPLPYAIGNGIQPLFTEKSLKELIDYQYTLVDNLNKLTSDSEFSDYTIYEIITKTAQDPSKALIFNYASQAWNNDFFLQGLTPKGVTLPEAFLHERIKQTFGSIDDFKTHFKDMALGLFGSGWTWLVETEFRQLRVVNTYNAGTTLDTTRLQEKDPNNHPTSLLSSPFLTNASQTSSQFAQSTGSSKPVPPPSIALNLIDPPPHKSKFTPLLCLNVWEHAYLKDFGIHGKETYIDQFWECVDWTVVHNRAASLRDVQGS